MSMRKDNDALRQIAPDTWRTQPVKNEEPLTPVENPPEEVVLRAGGGGRLYPPVGDLTFIRDHDSDAIVYRADIRHWHDSARSQDAPAEHPNESEE